MQFKSLLFSLAALQSVQAAVIKLEARATVAHDSISPVAEKVQSGNTGTLIKKFEPYLHIAHGCQSYPAVDEAGNVGGGLNPSGSSSGGCSDTSKGQTYVRATTRNGRLAIMYSWYMPKDQPTSGVSIGAHRHDWENVIIFVDPSTGNLISGAASGHGNYKKTATPQSQGTRPKVEYFTTFPTNHELQFTATLGRDLPMIDYDVMTSGMKNALETTDFGSANVPFKDANFVSNIDKATL